MIFAEVALVFIYGLVFGSFINVLILRLPEDRKISGRSQCPYCGHQLRAADLVPLFSFIFLRGRCRYCREKISWRYPAIEFFSGVLLSSAFLKFFPSDPVNLTLFLRAGFILLTLVIVFMVDLEHFLILDKVIFPAGAILLFLNFFADLAAHADLKKSLTFNGVVSAIGLVAVFAAIYYLSRGTWLGFGDVKLALFLGLATPAPYIFVSVFSGFLIGALIGVILLLFGGKNLKTELPFGTFLSVAAALTIFFGPAILNYYLHLIGLGYLAKYA